MLVNISNLRDNMFNEDLNTAVLTTRFVFTDKKPILSVFHHDEDGMWEFCGEDQLLIESDYRVVSLQEMIELDPTIQDVSNLPLGRSAKRECGKSTWIMI